MRCACHKAVFFPLVGACLLSVGVVAKAELLVYEPFDYTVANSNQANGFLSSTGGNMLGLTGQTSPSPIGLAGNTNRSGLNSLGGWDGSTSGNRAVVAGSLSYTGLPTAGNKAQTAFTGSNDRLLNTPISAGPGKTYYISALLNYGAVRSHYIQLDLRNYVGTTLTSPGVVNNGSGGTVNSAANWGVFTIGGPGANFLMIGPNAGMGGSSPDSNYLGSAGQVQANQTVLLVAKLAYTNALDPGTFQVYANPDLSLNEAANAGTLLRDSGGNTTTTRYAGSWNAVTMFVGSGETDGFVDEIRIATTWDEAVGIVPEPGTVGLLASAALGLAGLTLFRRRR